MKQGRTLTELAMELDRQRNVKKDYLADTRSMIMDADSGAALLSLRNDTTGETTIFHVNEIAHDQIGTNLGIPAKYYDRMRKENPELLANNVNSWFQKDPKTRMIRTLDGVARAFLSDRYRRIDNYEIAQAVLPVLATLPEANVESCEVTDRRMYLKVVNPRLTAEVTPGDIVQSGILISNSEVGLGSVSIQPLIYRLVCSNGMVVNDAATMKRHVGRSNTAGEDFSLYSDATLLAEDQLMVMKIKDTIKAVVEQTRFDKVVGLMRQAKEAKITSTSIPAMVEMAGSDFGYTKNEGESILDYLIRGGDLSLYGFANSITRAAQDVESYDRSTALEAIGFNVLNMGGRKWRDLNAVEASVA